MLRIGRIAYANCTPIFTALLDNGRCENYQFVSGVPAQLNAKLAAGTIDVCPSSSFEYARHSDLYYILPQLSISSTSAVASVLLFSRIPLDDLDGCTILLSSESATSVNLLRILLAKRFGFTCSFKVYAGGLDEALHEYPALLLIGDTALRESVRRSDLYIYDLGQLWSEWTGLPFVFALWLCRRAAAAESCTAMSRLAEELVLAKERARHTFQVIAERSDDLQWMGVERLTAYWQENISYDLGSSHLEGLKLFFRYCVELGLLPSTPALDFLDGNFERDL
jgi:chorismate dehydratase